MFFCLFAVVHLQSSTQNIDFSSFRLQKRQLRIGPVSSSTTTTENILSILFVEKKNFRFVAITIFVFFDDEFCCKEGKIPIFNFSEETSKKNGENFFLFTNQILRRNSKSSKSQGFIFFSVVVVLLKVKKALVTISSKIISIYMTEINRLPRP